MPSHELLLCYCLLPCSTSFQPGELVGFHAPDALLRKMRRFMSCVRTDPGAADDELLRRSEAQVAAWAQERKRLSGGAGDG